MTVTDLYEKNRTSCGIYFCLENFAYKEIKTDHLINIENIGIEWNSGE